MRAGEGEGENPASDQFPGLPRDLAGLFIMRIRGNGLDKGGVTSWKPQSMERLGRAHRNLLLRVVSVPNPEGPAVDGAM